MAAPEITVVVPTHDRPRSLARCLAALDAQTVRDSLEVVVVDDSRRQSAKAAADRFKGGRVLAGPCRGAAAARNAGVAEARAPLVLLTDDDCEPSPAWAATLASALEHEAPAVVGPTVSPAGENAFGVASQHIASFLTRCSIDGGGRVRFAASNNLGCRAEVLDRIPFDESYPASGGEDRDWCARLLESGHELVLMPDAVVTHAQELTLGAFLRKNAGYGRGARMFHRRHGHPDTGRLGRFQLRLIREAFRRGPAVGSLVCLAQVATAAGFTRQALSEGRERAA